MSPSTSGNYTSGESKVEDALEFLGKRLEEIRCDLDVKHWQAVIALSVDRLRKLREIEENPVSAKALEEVDVVLLKRDVDKNFSQLGLLDARVIEVNTKLDQILTKVGAVEKQMAVPCEVIQNHEVRQIRETLKLNFCEDIHGLGFTLDDEQPTWHMLIEVLGHYVTKCATKEIPDKLKYPMVEEFVKLVEQADADPSFSAAMLHKEADVIIRDGEGAGEKKFKEGQTLESYPLGASEKSHPDVLTANEVREKLTHAHDAAQRANAKRRIEEERQRTDILDDLPAKDVLSPEKKQEMADEIKSAVIVDELTHPKERDDKKDTREPYGGC